MPDFDSDVHNPNNPAYRNPSAHPHHGRPWLDPAREVQEDDAPPPQPGDVRSSPPPDDAQTWDDHRRLRRLSTLDAGTAMFIRLRAPVYVRANSEIELGVLPTDVLFNVNRIGYAIFTTTRKAMFYMDDRDGGWRRVEVPAGTPAVEMEIEGELSMPASRGPKPTPIMLVFPGPQADEWHRLKKILDAQVIEA